MPHVGTDEWWAFWEALEWRLFAEREAIERWADDGGAGSWLAPGSGE